MRKFLTKLVPLLGDSVFSLINYAYLHKKYGLPTPRLDLRNPTRFNHKLIWLKTHYRHPNATLYADKVLVKDFIAKTVNSEIVIPTLGVWDDANDIDFGILPDSFILKTNHGSGWNILVTNKAELDQLAVRRTLNAWLDMNYFAIGREYQYRDIAPRIIAEVLLVPDDGRPLLDYKFFCFNGEPHFVQIDFDRFTNHTRNFYDLKWNRLPFHILYPPYPGNPEKPDNLKKMIEIARILSEGFPFIRVDLYDYAGQIYFGELTFHPEGGFGPVTPDEWDERLGAMLVLPQVNA